MIAEPFSLPVVAKLADGRNHLSHSAMQMYRGCPWRYFLKYVEGVPEEGIPASLAFGSAFHAAVQRHYEQMLIGQVAGLDELLDYFWESWKASAEMGIEFTKNETLSHVVDRIGGMLRAFLASEIANAAGRIVGIEEDIRGSLLPDYPDIVAKLDLILERNDELWIVDFKTSKSRWGVARISEAAGQLRLYAQLARPLAGDCSMKMAFAVVTKAKRRPTLHMHVLQPLPSDRATVVAELRDVWLGIQSGDFPARPSPMRCPRCPYRHDCRAWLARRE